LKVLDGLIRLFIWSKLDVTVGVLGHASRTGEGSFDNQGLSQRRAAAVDQYLRKISGTSIKFFKAGGTGSKEEVSKDPNYHDVWPKLESLDEDERDRSVVVLFQWQPPGIIDAIAESKIDWDKAFDQAASAAALKYLVDMSTRIVADYAPSPGNIPWNPVTGWPNSWTTGSPNADDVMRAMGKIMIDVVESRARVSKLNISRDDIIRHYQDWLKNPKNKWVNP
jgi:hypothetical protein